MRLIDADALPFERYGKDVISWYATGWNDAINVINRAPTVDAEPVRHGGWIERPTGAYGAWQTWCSACGKHSGIGGIKSNRHKPYCPNCGAKMDGGKQDANV